MRVVMRFPGMTQASYTISHFENWRVDPLTVACKGWQSINAGLRQGFRVVTSMIL